MTDKSKSNPKQKRNDEKNKIKKTYKSPHLEVYGSLTSLTNGKGGLTPDGSSGSSKN